MQLVTIVYISLLALLCKEINGLSPSTYLSSVDKDHLKQVLDSAWSLEDLPQVLYASAGYKHLGLVIPNKQNICKYVKSSIKEGSSVENLYFASAASKALDCPLAPPSSAKQTLAETLQDGSSSQELFYSVLASANLGIDFDSQKVIRAVQQALKKDDSVLSLGYAFHVGSYLKGDVSSIFDRIEDAIVQADEVDGQMMQFEGGLSITALVLSGAYRLAEVTKRPIPIKSDQVVKFSNYLMSRKSVQMPKGVFYLLEAVTMLTNNKYHVPVAITLDSSVSVSESAPKVQVKVTNLMGVGFPDLKVKAIAASEANSGKIILSNKQLTKTKEEPSVYEIDIMSAKPSRGFYKLLISADGTDKRLVGNVEAQLTFKVLTVISLKDIEFGVADTDQSTSPTLKKITYPIKMAGALEADQHQRVILRFIVQDVSLKKSARVHQAFVKVTHASSKREIIFVAEPDSNDVYKFDLDVAAKKKEFGGFGGRYSMSLIIGDASISNPMTWDFAELDLSFPDEIDGTEPVDFTYKVLPEITHLFRTPDPRPPKFVSTLFTGLCLAPLLVLFIGWAKLGVNLSNFCFSPSTLGFHLGLGSMFGLCCLFWYQLDMFTTLRYMFMLGIVTFFCGNSMLSTIAAKRKEKKF